MKICFLTYSIFDLGGIQRVVSVIANELVDKGFDIDVICTCDKYPIDRKIYNLDSRINVKIKSDLVSKGIMTKIFTKFIKILNKKIGIFDARACIQFLSNIYFPSTMKKKFIDYLNNEQYDIIIGVAGEYSLLLGMLSDHLTGRTIGWQHNSYDAYFNTKSRYFWNQKSLFEYYLRQLDQYIVLTENDQYLLKKNMNIDSIVLYNPKSFVSKEKSQLHNRKFLAAGRFNYQKGFDLLLQSFEIFSKKNSDWELVIVGDGEEKKNIKSLINQYNLNNRVKVDGFTDDMKSYFLQSSILLVPSRWEGMPMIVLEALEMGVPIIAYDIPAIKQIINNKSEGMVVNSFNVNQFSEAMLELSSSYPLRQKLSENCIKRANDFEISVIIDKWISLFKSYQN